MIRNLATVTCMILTVAMGGCAVTAPQNTPVRERYETDPSSGAGYWIYVPSTYRHSRPAPLIVSCHGTPPFDVANHHIRQLKMLGEQNGCIIVCPEVVGTDGVLGDGPVVGMMENEKRIMSIISRLGYRYNIDMNNIMLTGFSGGGFAVYWVGTRHPDVFSVLVLRSCNFSKHNVDGWFPPEAASLPVLVYWGSNDPAAIKFQSMQGVKYLRSRGFVVTTDVIPGSGHERHPEVAMAFFRRNWKTPKPSLPSGRR